MEANRVMVVLGRLPHPLAESKIWPIASATSVTDVLVCHDNLAAGPPGVRYASPPGWATSTSPGWLRRLVRNVVEPLFVMRCGLQFRPDSIIGFYTLPKGLQAVLAARLVGARSLVAVIGSQQEIETYWWPRPFWKRANLALLHRADLVLTKGPFDNEYLSSCGIPANKVVTFNGAIDTGRFAPRRDDSRDIDILFVGGLRKLKGPMRVLEVVRRLQAKRHQLRATFLGTGPQETDMRTFIVQNGLEDVVDLVGYRRDTHTFMQRSKVLVMPSRSEGLSTAMLEAMACGCVPVSSDVGNQSEAVAHGKNGYLVADYQDLDTFGDFAAQIVDSEEIRSRLSDEAVRLVQRRYSIAAQAREIDAILSRLRAPATSQSSGPHAI